MRHSRGAQELKQLFRNLRMIEPYPNSLLRWMASILLMTFLGMGGCSSNSNSTSDPTKEEVQTDSDRFFKNLEKEETKKEEKDSAY